ncbi:alpha/beta fold hydrolase [Saccharothrix sp. CCNWLY140-2]|uniref:alpha/beta hydrolase n=1 Tax=Saccharothrix sp. CCNWLY140-2 TaxID=3138500 RepID=UPI0032151F0B
MAVSGHEAEQVERANGSGRVPVVFIHGLWLLPGSWARWVGVFEDAGYAAVVPDWPGDPETVAEANAHPETLAGHTVGEVADHVQEVIGGLTRKPAVVGHSFGGLLTQILAGRGVSAPRRRWPSIPRRSGVCCRCRCRRCGRRCRCWATPPTGAGRCR